MGSVQFQPSATFIQGIATVNVDNASLFDYDVIDRTSGYSPVGEDFTSELTLYEDTVELSAVIKFTAVLSTVVEAWTGGAGDAIIKFRIYEDGLLIYEKTITITAASDGYAYVMLAMTYERKASGKHTYKLTVQDTTTSLADLRKKEVTVTYV